MPGEHDRPACGAPVLLLRQDRAHDLPAPRSTMTMKLNDGAITTTQRTR